MARLTVLLAFVCGACCAGQSVALKTASDRGARGASAPVLPDVAVGGAVELPAGSPLALAIDRHMPMRVGERLNAHLLYAVYGGDELVLAKGTVVSGTVVSLLPDRTHRLEARLRADFTPFRTPVVQFDRVVLADGRTVAISTSQATDGAPVFRLVPPPPARGGFVRQQVRMGWEMVKDRVRVVTGPEKKDRLEQLLYSQLPYHPQRIAAGTAWTVETTEPVALARLTDAAAAGNAAAPANPDAEGGTSRRIEAYLKEPLSSRTSVSGEAIRAVVCEPVWDADRTVAIPVGSVMTGTVTQARPARRFGRAGVLRFDFRELTLPDGGETRHVQTNLEGIDAVGGQNLALDSEGRVKPKPQDKVVVPLIFLALASRPLDRDHGDNAFGKDAVASNSLGLAGFLIGTAGGWRNVAAGIGYYGAALSLYNRWIKRGQETRFPLDTRVVLQTTVRRSGPMAVPSR